MQGYLLEILRCPATGAALSLDALERDGDDVLFGILRAGAEEYPVVWGVPVLLPGHHEAVRLLRGGQLAGAAAAAILTQLAPSRLGRLAAALAVAPGGAAAGGVAARRDRRRFQAALMPLLERSGDDPLALVRLGFEGWGDRNPEAVNYFTYRFGTPRHLVALAVVEASVVGAGPVLDLGCGAGHLSWGLRQRFGADRTIGLDLSLFELWAARGVAADGRFVCGDATALPFASGSFGMVMASDVLSFIRDKWAATREAARVLGGDGTLAVAAVKNALQPHVYAGMPLPPDGWRALAGDLPHRLHADDVILERYLAGDAMDGDDVGDPAGAPTVTLVAGAGAGGRGVRAPGEWPHAQGPLGVNPLLRLAAEEDDRLVYRRRFPSVGFADDNPPLRDYLPEEVVVPRAALTGDQLDRGQVEHLIASTAVLALPTHYRRAQLPGAPRQMVPSP